MENNTCILPLSYWGNIFYFSKLIEHNEVIIEINENYQKKTYRNRCELYGPNGKLSIQVPVEKGSFHKINMNDLKISYDTAWQKNHLKTIQAAYKSSPYYEFYEDDLIPIYETNFVYLKDLNLKILEVCQEWLAIETNLTLSTKYITSNLLEDYRMTISPKINPCDQLNYTPIAYTQGFELRHGFIPNLSILDLIFNLGPESYQALNSK